MRKLAGTTDQSISTIATIVGTVQEEIGNLSRTLKTASAGVAESQRMSKGAQESLGQIRIEIGSISGRILLELKGSVQRQFQTIRDVRSLLSRALEGFDEIAAISGETKGHIRAVREGSESLGQAVDRFQV